MQAFTKWYKPERMYGTLRHQLESAVRYSDVRAKRLQPNSNIDGVSNGVSQHYGNFGQNNEQRYLRMHHSKTLN